MATDSFLTNGLTLYRQKRLDNGIRTGLMLGGDVVLGRFDEGDPDEYNPVLVWSVDLRCLIDPPPGDAEAARQWLFENAEVIGIGFERFAEHLAVGTDVDLYPLEWDDFRPGIPGVEMKIVCSAMRRVDALQLANVLDEVRKDWEPLLNSLEAPSRTLS